MGRAALLMAMLGFLVTHIRFAQTERTIFETDRHQSERQAEILAREIARSGYDATISRMLRLAKANGDADLEALVSEMNDELGRAVRSHQGGVYEARVYPISASTFGVVSIGRYGDATHRIGASRLRPGILEVTQPSRLKATFIDSQAGYCSAIYLQRWVPNGDGTYTEETPELVFASGKDRDDSTTVHTTLLKPGELMNFMLAVDMDCSLRGQPLSWQQHHRYDYHHVALSSEAGSLEEMQEGKYAMIEPHPFQNGIWRIGFEDLIQFSDAQHGDVKQNGYGYGWDRDAQTYGGTGWRTNATGYRLLQDYGNKPDFSDQVFEVELIPHLGV